MVQDGKFFTTGTIIYFVLHMLSYVFFTYMLYHFYSDSLSPIMWRVFIPVTAFLNIASSLVPAFYREQKVAAKEGDEFNHAYLYIPIIILIISFMILVRCYILWSFSFSDDCLEIESFLIFICIPLLNLMLNKYFS